MNLSEHFTLNEMTITEHRIYAARNHDVPQNLMRAGIALCESLLEPIRLHYGAPVSVHSGYRMPELNAAIGGQRRSQHMLFEAADFHVVGFPLKDVWHWICNDSGLRFGQCLLEGFGGKFSWIHISLGKPWRKLPCQQILTSMNGGYTWISKGQ